MADNKKISGFKKFSDLNSKKEELEEVSLNGRPEEDSDRPGNPNLPVKDKKVEKMPSRKNLIPKDQNVDLNSPIGEEETNEENKVKLFTRKVK